MTLGFLAAALFVIAFLINATSTSTSAVFSPLSLRLVELACIALHLAGIGTGWVAAFPPQSPLSTVSGKRTSWHLNTA